MVWSSPTYCGPGCHSPGVEATARVLGPPKDHEGCCCLHRAPKTLGGSRYPLTAPPRGSQAQSLLPPARKPSPGKVCLHLQSSGRSHSVCSGLQPEASDSRLSLLSSACSTPTSPNREGGRPAPPAMSSVSQPLGCLWLVLKLGPLPQAVRMGTLCVGGVVMTVFQKPEKLTPTPVFIPLTSPL